MEPTINQTSLVEQLEAYKEQTFILSDENTFFRKKFGQLQQEANKIRAQLSRQDQVIFSRDQELSEVRAEFQAVARAKREIEKRLEKQVEEQEFERSQWQEKEQHLMEDVQQLQHQVKVLQEEAETAAAELSDAKATIKQCVSESGTMEESMQMLRDARTAQRQLRDREKLCYELRLELERQKNTLDEVIDQYKTQQLKMAYLENEVGNLQKTNQSLNDDCKAYQRLLQEKTVNGQFSIAKRDKPKRTSLQLELEQAFSSSRPKSPGSPLYEDRPISRHMHLEDEVMQLTEELKASQDEVKAMTLYVNKILARIMDSNQLSMLANDKDYEKETKRQEAEAAGGFEVLKRHFRRQSLTSTVTQIESEKPSETAEEGMWRKALKRMSSSAWRSPAVSTKTLDDTSGDIKLLSEAAKQSKCSVVATPIEEEKEEDVIETLPMEVK